MASWITARHAELPTLDAPHAIALVTDVSARLDDVSLDRGEHDKLLLLRARMSTYVSSAKTVNSTVSRRWQTARRRRNPAASRVFSCGRGSSLGCRAEMPSIAS